MDKYNPQLSFAGWVRKLMINTAIDHYRKNKRFYDRHPDLSHVKEEPQIEEVLDKIGAEELLELIQQLPPAYRMVFTLYAVEEYNHREIAEKLGISEGTSKSNYSKARLKLKQLLLSVNPSLDEQYGA
ncbi:putative RNA polymerase ECF-type sigma factor [Cyclobacterium qasimii M12-11B]|uniref:Putative RNA polymerase ECF-type sigma factor n=1 Tax=Cyclobacterium qasimii M12-11B TaxID=641524 RepID=S7V572_9BACT|nr:putative RNA polymerase ECF-type sigma factor [Cyclobacterium qasimii M12-11B]